MHADPLLQAFADAEAIEHYSRGLASIARVDARQAALFDEPAGFSVWLATNFTVEPDRLVVDTVVQVRYMRVRLRAFEAALRLMMRST
jgi:hypothetical protein